MSFEGKVVLITGATSGIGAGLAEFYAKEGAKLAIVGRNAEKFEEIIGRIKEIGIETEPLIIMADVITEAERIISETIEHFGRLDVLINNAGIILIGAIETISMEDYDKIMATNVRSLVELTKLATPFLIETKGNIVNVSSCAGSVTSCIGNVPVYAMSKAAVNYFTKCLAVDLASKGVRVNAIAPGYIDDTKFYTYIDPDLANAYAEYIITVSPMQFNGNTGDCVNGIAFLTKDSSSFLTG